MPLSTLPRILVMGSTGQVGSRVLERLLDLPEIEVVAGVRSREKAAAFTAQNVAAAVLDLDDIQTMAPALEGIDRLFMMTGYTVDMLRQSKVLVDQARRAGVRHIVRLGACGRDDATVGHWAWHQMIERYVEGAGLSYTHLRPEAFMQNLLSYGGKPAIENGVLHAFCADARLSWVDVDDVAKVAAAALLRPDLHAGKTYRLGYEAATHGEIAALMAAMTGRSFRYEPLSPEVFLEDMRRNGADMTYMQCVYEHWISHAARAIPGADDIFDDFPAITGEQPTTWAGFIEKHRQLLMRCAG